MQYSPILGVWTDYIWLAFVGATVIGSWISNAKKNANKRRQLDERMGPQDLEQVAATRREQLREVSQQRVQADLSGGASGGGGSGNMTMAERIARARAKAQQEQRGSPQGDPAGSQMPNEAQRRVLEQRRAEQERSHEAAAQQQRAQQQQSQQRAQQQSQQQARQQHAQAHSRAKARARQRGRLVHEPVPVPEQKSFSPRRAVSSKPKKSQQVVEQPVLIEDLGEIVAGSLTHNDLRRAIIMNEVLGKPIALKGTDGW